MCTKIAKSLKYVNTKPILYMGLANAVIYELMILGIDPSAIKWVSHIPPIIAGALVPAVNGIISVKHKEVLVFWLWNGQVPGCRAFSHLAPKDRRIDLEIIRKKYGEFPIEPEAQNKLWYRLYSFEKDDPSVQSCNQYYLFTRDFASMLAVFAIPLSILGIMYSEKSEHAAMYIATLVAQYLVFMCSAITYGERLVTTAMAVSSTREF